MKEKLFQYVLIASFTGFLFGFDSVVISGANLPIKHLWETSEWYHGTFIISISLWGMVIGSLFGGYPTEKLGRKNTLILVGLVFTISSLGTALATNPHIFSFFRFIGGVGAGVGSIAAPTYIAEITTAENRGRSGMLFQLNIVLGIVVALFSNYFLAGVSGSDDWRWMLGVMVIPSSVYTVLLARICESPRWLLLKKKDEKKAMAMLGLISSKEDADRLASVIDTEGHNRSDNAGLFSGKYRKILVLSFLISFFNQFSGISFILFYAPEIFEKAGFATADSLLSAVSVGFVNLVFTVAGIYLIDKIGRKRLMYVGSVGYITSLSLVAYGFYADAPASFILIFILLFITSHAIGQGAVIWVFIAEIFPNKIRSFGQAWGAGLLNVFAALTTSLGAVLINSFAPWMIFGAFACLMVLQLLFVWLAMPETKGVSLEALEQKLTAG